MKDAIEIQYSFSDDDCDFDAEAKVHGDCIGYARCFRKGDRLQILDILVNDDLPRSWPVLPNLLRTILGRRRPLKLRGRGIGSRLLDRILMEANSRGIREIWGSVTDADIQRWAGLLAWYEKHGFTVREPDHECINTAAKKVTRQNQAF